MNRCTRAVIYKDNLIYNLKQIIKYVEKQDKIKNLNQSSNPKKTHICVAVKADSYGHDAILTSKIAEELGIDYLAVATVDEGIELRNAGIKANILLLSLSIPEEFEELFQFNITPVIFSKDYINLLSKAANQHFNQHSNKHSIDKNEKHPVFLAVDTGMGRVGCYDFDAGNEAKLISDSEHLTLAGMITHFCVSDSLEEKNQKFTECQYKSFLKAIENVKAQGIDPGICSCGASAGLLNNFDMYFDMVRPGIITYGYYPDEITKEYLQSQNREFDIKPVLSLETKVVAIRHFTKGQSISYGRTYVCDKDTDIAVLPVGYADGLLRRFSPGVQVTINGKAYPVCGRICMDQCMVDIGKDNKDVNLFDKAVIFGPKESGATQTAEDLAKLGNTISYEVLTSLSKRVQRVIKS